MKKILVLMVLLMASAVGCHVLADMPAVAYITINGERYEYLKGAHTSSRFFINKTSNEKFLKGVAFASQGEIAEAEVQCIKWCETPVFTIALMVVDYAGDRSEEKYVITYKHEGGIIDGTLALSSYDTKIASGEYKFPEAEKTRFRPEIDDDDIRLSADSIIVTRRYNSNITVDTTLVHVEDGWMVIRYGVSTVGKISREPEMPLRTKRCDFSFSGGKNMGRTPVTEQTDALTAGVGMTLLNLYCMPASYDGLPAMTAELERQLKADVEQYGKNEKSMKKLAYVKEKIAEWQKHLINREPSQWLMWLYQHPDVAPAQLMENVKSDPAFGRWLQGEVSGLQDKAARQWWQKKLQ